MKNTSFNKLKSLRDSREEGFTLIELLVVIVIIGVLAAIALPIFLNQVKLANRAEIKSQVRNAQTEIRTMLVKYPQADISSSSTKPEDVAGKQAWFNLLQKWAVVGEAKGYTVYLYSEMKPSQFPSPVTNTGARWDNYSISGYKYDEDIEWVYIFNSITGKYSEVYFKNGTREIIGG